MSEQSHGIDFYPGVARTVYLVQLTQTQIENFHNREINRGYPYPSFLMRQFYPDNIKKTGSLSLQECSSVKETIDNLKPKARDLDEDKIEWYDYQHSWDWNIFYKGGIELSRVGKLAKRGKALTDELED